MNMKTYRGILIFVAGTTPQIVTETLYCLTQTIQPPIFPDEIYIITTSNGKDKIKEELLDKGLLTAFSKEFNLPPIPLTRESIHVICDEKGNPLEDIREVSHNESLGDFIADFVRDRTEDPSVRLHCSLAGGRKTMSFYLGSALQLFGRTWDKLYHVLVTPEFESHPDFYYKPKKNRVLELKDNNGKVLRRLHTKNAQISLAELPFVRLRDKIPLGGRGFKELVREGQREIDIASIQPSVRLNLSEKVVYIGHVGIDMVPIQMVLYVNLLRRKIEGCHFSERLYCLDCIDCFPFLGDLSNRKTLEEIVKDYQKAYGPSSGRVEEFRRHWEKRGGIDSDTLRQNISKINTTLKESIKDETLLPYFIISPIGKHGSKRYGIRVEKEKISIE
ncbi:MAG: CRISPR-associated protein [Deltaproteobacteria bacterium RBG_16_47_11]|nr:MAG: CRISPR-associated protein [Deltaproteobacteria bacterium RBG_16_47_11]